MSSANDNINSKDGLDSPYKIRSKDVSTPQDGSLQRVLHLASPYPVDYGVGGIYHSNTKNGNTMGAGLAAASIVYAFQNPSSTLLALITRLRLSAWSLGTGFAAGLATFDMKIARSFTAMDTGGTLISLSGNEAKLRTAMNASAAVIRIGATAGLAAGTRTLDTNTVESLDAAVTTATNTPFFSNAKLFETLAGDHPLLLAQNEGFEITATVPATGTWAFQITAEWAEVPLVNY